ncbi:MAG: valine--tRNA ligase [Planctomycetaceae bacterium]|nr:valine--tRNA ligase [Planctomycetaceae bacterium]
MTNELDKSYDPQTVEAHVTQRWADVNAFHAEPDDPGDPGDPYCIVIPPPNVTAALHLGHALNNTLQDVIIRWRRMAGDNAVWIPGTDHAGIATQTVVEKRLLQEKGKRRTDYSRDAFVARTQAWKDEYEQRITEQLQAMGCSCDWERRRFTMDPTCAHAVREAFFRLYKDGLIYRGKRLVNWDPVTQTALADDEVESEAIDGHFWYMNYPLVNDDGSPCAELDHVTVATTRPETMLGDTAVAINPADPRAADLRGKCVRLPIVNRIIPIIEDDYVVQPDPDSSDEKARFATGFLKVTPAHDPNDYEIGQRHDLLVINVFAPDASISKDHGWLDWGQTNHDPFCEHLQGLDRYEAREAIVTWFREQDLLQDVRPYQHAVGHSYRSHVPIEPYLSDQWYVKVTDDRLAGAALRAMTADQRMSDAAHTSTSDSDWQNQLRFTPARYARTFQQWHENIRDWCISRQLWWGHQIPVWRRPKSLVAPPRDIGQIVEQLQQWYFEGRLVTQYRGEFVPLADVEKQDLDLTAFFYCVRDPDGHDRPIVEFLESLGLERDPDVLDTWFSSALWPISTLGWPNEDNNAPLQAWNPSSTLITAREIITLWVSRMVMFNIYFRDCLPFTDVFIHAMIQDGDGQKMSKSLGNGVDPLDIIHSHGADAMRFTLVSMTTQTQDVRLPVDIVCPHTGKMFEPHMTTDAAGHHVAAPIQDCPEDPTRKMVSGYGLASGKVAPTDDMPLARNTSPKFDNGRNFANKMWNAGRFAMAVLARGADQPTEARPHTSNRSLADRWILARLARTIQQADDALAGFQFSVYSQALYDFFWRDLCDWYLEAIKPVVANDDPAGATSRQTLAACLDAALRLMHPAMPYITERLWQHLNDVLPDRQTTGVNLSPSDLCVRAPWPTIDPALIDAQAESDFDWMQQIVAAVRQVRNIHKVSPRQTVPITARASAELADRTAPIRDLIQTMASAEVGDISPKITKPDDAVATVIGDMEIYVHGLVDAAAESDQLTKRLEDLQKNQSALTGRLNNKGYTDKAPAHLVQQTRDQLADVEKEIAAVQGMLNQ